LDDQGTVNFTEDPGNIPQKYRKKAKIVGEEEPTVDAVKEEAGSREKAPESAETKGTAPLEKQEKKKAVYGGKDESAWKAEFAQVRGELKSIDELLTSKKTLFSDPSKLSRTEYKTLQYEIKSLEQRWNDTLEKLKGLRSAATREGVPAEIQQ
jgi:hypothetical protein